MNSIDNRAEPAERLDQRIKVAMIGSHCSSSGRVSDPVERITISGTKNGKRRPEIRIFDTLRTAQHAIRVADRPDPVPPLPPDQQPPRPVKQPPRDPGPKPSEKPPVEEPGPAKPMRV